MKYIKLFEQFINEDQIKGGLSDNMSLEDIANKHEKDPQEIDNMIQFLEVQLEKGIKVEMEHTEDPEIATEIAKDHLFEDPKYYIKLATIEG